MTAKEINALVFLSPSDKFETPESLVFLKSIKGIEFVELPGFEGKKKGGLRPALIFITSAHHHL